MKRAKLQAFEMRDDIKFEYEGSDVALPLTTGTEKETAIEIAKLRGSTGLITLDIGYKNTGSTTSDITFIDGDKGILRYRGYSIEDLSEHANFLEVAYLLIFGELPTADELSTFTSRYHRYSFLDEHIQHILAGFPPHAHPMGVLSALTSALTAFHLRPLDINDHEQVYCVVAEILARFPILGSWSYRNSCCLPLNQPRSDLDYAANLSQMLFRMPNTTYEIDPVITRALDKLLILHADHEQNCSTSAVRLIGSSQANLFACLAGGISALWGPLHGGANQAVIEMLENIKMDGGHISKYIDKAKDKSDPFRLMGFGHRVYKNFDPRAKIIKKSAHEVLDKLGMDDPILDIALELEYAALEDPYFIERKLFPNVDFYSGIIYRALGISNDMFTVMFALGRLPGWVAQWLELRRQNQPIGRPRQVYTGHTHRPFTPIDER